MIQVPGFVDPPPPTYTPFSELPLLPSAGRPEKTCLLVEQEDMSSCRTRRRVFLFNKKTCILVKQGDMSP